MKAPLDKLTKIDAARSQLATAINLFFDDVDPISVHSLACASAEILETICRKNGKQTFFAHMRESNPKFTSKKIRETLNKCKNWFKHADKDHGDVLTDFSDVLNDYAIFMASHDYGSIENWKPIEIQVFQLWFSTVYKKHMDPRLGIVQQLFPDMDKKNRREQKLLGKNVLDWARTQPEFTMEALEDRLDAEDAAAALAELARGEDKAIPWKKAKKNLRRRKGK